ncbi:MAG: hypothetical protein A2Z91_07225 [Deltaproteobacteria bacterium GWA2_38_16]|nr:MAG: hypothetical protein A2Z91_07225 [Deltaproteobacteria bacterium GWA2_38_16]OGQ02701.1 MAG: hypothetical protein A3D19_00560 [Deltaproteobacteria bacterium RIFCSPHIGHO2_02_FULL_38_15]OGQ34060.1 MAG: hypothetical protein A3A72_00935 [Deltaproteobacteria bacterium RIFCSPLOWO2_01_FULL_38_9]OGQ59045.1 MAG: hypothetical protein A3G92_05090 [Deltaproteobacteria bacterium RIFCSPLOWO2_12_FULL_38_8]HBQ20558.1 hypothetical protein [Deltaproteobacteria bacterium]
MSISKKLELPKLISFYGALSLIALLWIKFAHFDIAFFGWKGLPESYLIAFSLFALSQGASHKTSWAEQLEKLFASLLTPLPLSLIFGISLFSSIGEELLFRGAIQNQFGLVAASILFGLVHFPMTKLMIPWTVMAMFMGFVLGGLYIYSGNLLAPIMLHFLINFLNLWALDQKYGQKSDL